MGSLTTFTVYNDGAALLDPRDPKNANNIKAFVEGVHNACLGYYQNRNEDSFGLGNFCNMVEVQTPRHADDHTVYVHMGNCVTELNAYGQRTKNLFKEHPEFANKLLKFLKESVKDLTKLQKEIEISISL